MEAVGSLGLKQYEAECFVALTRLSHGTAKKLSGLTDVSRTRVYDTTPCGTSWEVCAPSHTENKLILYDDKIIVYSDWMLTVTI